MRIAAAGAEIKLYIAVYHRVTAMSIVLSIVVHLSGV
jgi:hypothetical protein